MTFLNRLIKEAKADPRPCELTIRPNQVRAMVDHVIACMWAPAPPRDDLERMIRAGKLKILDVPVRVLGSNG